MSIFTVMSDKASQAWQHISATHAKITALKHGRFGASAVISGGIIALFLINKLYMLLNLSLWQLAFLPMIIYINIILIDALIHQAKKIYSDSKNAGISLDKAIPGTDLQNNKTSKILWTIGLLLWSCSICIGLLAATNQLLVIFHIVPSNIFIDAHHICNSLAIISLALAIVITLYILFYGNDNNAEASTPASMTVTESIPKLSAALSTPARLNLAQVFGSHAASDIAATETSAAPLSAHPT